MNKKHVFTWSLILFAVGCLGWKNPFANKTKEGNKLYAQEKYEEALKKYLDAQLDNPESEALHFNIGNVLFKQKKYKEAGEEYQKARQSEDIFTQAMAYYNLGNCKFRENDRPGAIEYFKRAVELNPDDQDAKFNLELTRRKLKEQTQKPKQQCQIGKDDQDQDYMKDPNGNILMKDPNGRICRQNPNQGKEQAQKPKQQCQISNDDQDQDYMKDPNGNILMKDPNGRICRKNPNQEMNNTKPCGENSKKSKEMSEEDALRILQALQHRENKEPKYISPPSKGREYIEYDW